MEDKVQKVINGAIDRLNELLPSGESLSKDTATVLLGKDGLLDSMGFVNLIVALEDECERQLGCQVVLADELSSGEGVRTIGDLQQLLIRVLQAQKASGGMTSGSSPNE